MYQVPQQTPPTYDEMPPVTPPAMPPAMSPAMPPAMPPVQPPMQAPVQAPKAPNNTDLENGPEIESPNPVYKNLLGSFLDPYHIKAIEG